MGVGLALWQDIYVLTYCLLVPACNINVVRQVLSPPPPPLILSKLCVCMHILSVCMCARVHLSEIYTHAFIHNLYRSLYLRTPRDCTATSLKLVLRGLELSEFDYHYVIEQETDSFQSKLGHRKARKDILRTEVKLVEHPGLTKIITDYMNIYFS